MLTLLLAGSLAVSAPVPKAVKKFPPDPDRFQGAWTVVENNGKPDTGNTVWTFTDGNMHSSSGNTNWVIKLDPDQSPRHIDITNYPGIYEFDGDKLTIAYTTGGTRPTGFTPGNSVMVSVLVRAKDQPGK